MTAASLPAGPRVLADAVPGALARDIALVVGGAGLTGIAAQVTIHTPLSPVPFTLQTLSVLVVGAALGPVRALASLLVYLVAGLAGVPWFADHAHGWSNNPSYGYLIGFVVAATVVGLLARQRNDRRVLSAVGAFAVGELILLTIGTVWLGVDLHLSATKAIALGVTPFLATDAIKMAAASLALPAAWRLVDRYER